MDGEKELRMEPKDMHSKTKWKPNLKDEESPILFNAIHCKWEVVTCIAKERGGASFAACVVDACGLFCSRCAGDGFIILRWLKCPLRR